MFADYSKLRASCHMVLLTSSHSSVELLPFIVTPHQLLNCVHLRPQNKYELDKHHSSVIVRSPFLDVLFSSPDCLKGIDWLVEGVSGFAFYPEANCVHAILPTTGDGL